MKKLTLIVLTILMAFTFCFGMTACADQIVGQIQNEIGAVLEGGNFKEGSVFHVNEVTITSEQADDIFEKLGDVGITVSDKTKALIYDIFVTKDGQEVQPNGKVQVTVPLPQDGTETDYAVYHVKDDEAVKIRSTYADGKITFETDGFSYYVFVATDYVSNNVNPAPVEVTLIATAGEGGTVTDDYANGKKVEKGTSVTISAIADNEYHFVGWFVGETKVSDEPRYTFTINEDTTLVAKFAKNASTNNFLALCDTNDGGYITENGQRVDFENGRMVEFGTQITLTAVANDGYTFKGWYRYTADQQVVSISTEATYTFTVNEPTTVFAKFEETLTYTFLAQCEPFVGGYITENNQKVDFGNGRMVEPNTKITLTAVANDGYVLKGWGTRDDNWNLTIISTDATHTFTVNKNTYVQAVFEEKPNGLKIDAHNAGFTYNENGELVTTVYQIGAANQPNIDYVGVYATYASVDTQDKYLTINEDYTRDLGGLDFTKVGTYTVTYTYKADASLKATLTVQVVAKAADGSMTETEWNAAITYWAKQTNIKVFERTVTSQSYDPNYGNMGADIRIYQLAGTAYSFDGYFEDDELSQQYKGKMTYLVKVDNKYYRYTWDDGEWNNDLEEYVGGYWVKEDYNAKEEYESEVSSNIYSFRDSAGDPIVFSYAKFTFDTETKSYKNSDGSIAIAFTFDDNKVLTKIVVTEIVTWDDGGGYTSVSTVTFGDAVVDVPTAAKCSFSIGVKIEDKYDVGGYITENGEKVEYWYDYLDDGTVLTLTAVADEGYVFKCWAKSVWDIDGREYVWITYSTEKTYTVTVDGEYGALYAVFEKV